MNLIIMKIYHYTNYCALKKILKIMCLKYGNFKNTNDPSEFLRYSSVPYSALVQVDKSLVFETFYTKVHSYKPLSFSIDGGRPGWQLPCMWAHYGDNHKGVCIELDLEKLSIDKIMHAKIKYIESIPVCNFLMNYTGKEKTFSEIVDNYISHNMTTLFFSKEQDWESEQEYRLIAINENSVLNIENAITGIYLGARFEKSVRTIRSYINKLRL